jgi:hypothetical protein
MRQLLSKSLCKASTRLQQGFKGGKFLTSTQLGEKLGLQLPNPTIASIQG